MTAESSLPCPVCRGPVRAAPDESLPYFARQPIWRCCGYTAKSVEAWNEYARERGAGRVVLANMDPILESIESRGICECLDEPCGNTLRNQLVADIKAAAGGSETYATPEIVRQAEKYRLIEAAYVAEKTAYDAGQGGGAARSAHLLLRTAEIIKLGR